MNLQPEKVPGPLGNALATFVAEAIHTGGLSLIEIVSRIVRSIVLGERASVGATEPIDNVFSEAEIRELAATLEPVIATGQLLGGLSVHQQAGDVSRSLFRHVANEIQPVQPRAAIEFFGSLVPKLGSNPERSVSDMRRKAFTVAVSTSEEVTARIQRAIERELHSGWDSTDAVQSILDHAGLSVRNPAYVATVVRTNVMEAYNEGQWDEATSDPDFHENFPVWEYHAIPGSRTRPKHAARNGKFWPTSRPFSLVRGTSIGDVANCRCNSTFLTRDQWERELARGAKLES